MPPVIGIDLGTTNSAAAFLGEDGPRIIPNAVGGRLTPSVVGVDEGGRVLVGAAAFTALPEVLRMAPTLRMVIYGLLLLVIVIRAPDGLEGLLARRAPRGRRTAPEA